ncbi:MAG: PqqD family protein [Bilifractor sp.]|jgi:hypothetical protein
MKLKHKFAYQKTSDGYVAVTVDEDADKFNGILHLNETGAFIMKLLGKEQTEDSIIRELQKEYEDSEGKMPSMVHAFLGKLRDAGLLEG